MLGNVPHSGDQFCWLDSDWKRFPIVATGTVVRLLSEVPPGSPLFVEDPHIGYIQWCSESVAEKVLLLEGD